MEQITRKIFQIYLTCDQTVEFEDNKRILLRKVNFAFMIPNPSLDCSYVILGKFEPRCSYKKCFYKKILINTDFESDFILRKNSANI